MREAAAPFLEKKELVRIVIIQYALIAACKGRDRQINAGGVEGAIEEILEGDEKEI